MNKSNLSVVGIVSVAVLAAVNVHAIQVVENGAFGSGLTGWSSSGNVEVVNTLSGDGGDFAGGAIAPTGGAIDMAVLNYYNSGADASVSLSQNEPNIDACYGTISFSYDLFAHNDQGTGEFTSANDGSSLEVYIGTTLIANLTYFDASGGGATAGGWQTFTLNLSSIPTGALSFDYTDSTEPNGYYSGVAIDNVSLQEFQCPDYASTGLLLSGALAALCVVKRKVS